MADLSHRLRVVAQMAGDERRRADLAAAVAHRLGITDAELFVPERKRR